MKIELSARQEIERAAFWAFADEWIINQADLWDAEEKMPLEMIATIASEGYLGALLPHEYGGLGMDMITFGMLNEEVGRGCSSIRNLLTVHNMVSYAILKWGSQEQKEYWLPKMASGEVIAAFALTEPNFGSDARGVETQAVPEGDGYVINGQKKWITFGQIADLFLVFAKCEGEIRAFLVGKENPGLSTEPISGLLGMRASMLAELCLVNCPTPRVSALGKTGFGSNAVLFTALNIGRYSVAWGCVGIAQGCLDASIKYSKERKQFGVYIKEHQLIQQMISNMLVNLKAARLLCYHAGYLHDTGNPSAVEEILISKYFASTMAIKAANDALQIHGANGCSREYPLGRYFRDAKIMEIIEGSTQIMQITIADMHTRNL